MPENTHRLESGADEFARLQPVEAEASVCAGRDMRAFIVINSLSSWGWLDGGLTNVDAKFEIFSDDIRDLRAVDAVTGITKIASERSDNTDTTLARDLEDVVRNGGVSL